MDACSQAGPRLAGLPAKIQHKSHLPEGPADSARRFQENRSRSESREKRPAVTDLSEASAVRRRFGAVRRIHACN